MIRIFKYIIILMMLTGITYSQVIPDNFNLTQKISLAKAKADGVIASNAITDLIVVGDTIWAAGDGLSVSFDNGISWKSFLGTTEFGTEGITALAYNNGVVWVATSHKETKLGEVVDVGTGLKYTLNNGVSWTSVPQPVDNQNDTTINYGVNILRALPITIAVNNITFDIAFTPGTVWITSWAGGLRKSTDYGTTWERVVIPPDYLDEIAPTDTLSFCLSPSAGKICSEGNLNHSAFSVISTNDSTLYVGTAGGINKSTDGGISWRKFNHQNQANPISGNFVVALGFNKNNNSLWAATWVAEGTGEFYSVSLSKDGGDNWTSFLNGERTHNFGFKGDDVIAVSDNGAFRSSNLGATWITPATIKDSQTNITLKTNTFFSATSQNNDIWLGSNGGLVKLTEGGSTWTGNWKLFFVTLPFTSTDENYAFPNPFSPRVETLKIKYSTGGKSVPVTIRIFDFGMNYVSTIIQNVTRGNPALSADNTGVIDYWDGRDANGNYVPNGIYFYRIDAGGSVRFGKILVVQ